MTTEEIREVIQGLELTGEPEWSMSRKEIEYETSKEEVFVKITRRNNPSTDILECVFIYGDYENTYPIGTTEYDILSNFVLTLDSSNENEEI